jgi:hypothetical protein
MSFGFSVGDFVLLTQLATATFQNARKACGAHDALTTEVSSMHIVLQRLAVEVSKPDSILTRTDDSRRSELATLAVGCKKILRVLSQILEKYTALSQEKRSATKIWQRIKFGNGEMLELNKIRPELATYTTALTIFLNLLSIGSQGKVEKYMDSHGGELRDIKSSLHCIMASMQASSHEEKSILTSYAEDDKLIWKGFRRELIKEGFSSQLLYKHKKTIKDYVMELGERGALDELVPDSVGPSLENAIVSTSAEQNQNSPIMDRPPKDKSGDGLDAFEAETEIDSIAMSDSQEDSEPKAAQSPETKPKATMPKIDEGNRPAASALATEHQNDPITPQSGHYIDAIATKSQGSSSDDSGDDGDDENIEEALRCELIKEVSSQVLYKHKKMIKRYVRELGARGALDKTHESDIAIVQMVAEKQEIATIGLTDVQFDNERSTAQSSAPKFEVATPEIGAGKRPTVAMVAPAYQNNAIILQSMQGCDVIATGSESSATGDDGDGDRDDESTDGPNRPGPSMITSNVSAQFRNDTSPQISAGISHNNNPQVQDMNPPIADIDPRRRSSIPLQTVPVSDQNDRPLYVPERSNKFPIRKDNSSKSAQIPPRVISTRKISCYYPKYLSYEDSDSSVEDFTSEEEPFTDDDHIRAHKTHVIRGSSGRPMRRSSHQNLKESRARIRRVPSADFGSGSEEIDRRRTCLQTPQSFAKALNDLSRHVAMYPPGGKAVWGSASEGTDEGKIGRQTPRSFARALKDHSRGIHGHTKSKYPPRPKAVWGSASERDEPKPNLQNRPSFSTRSLWPGYEAESEAKPQNSDSYGASHRKSDEDGYEEYLGDGNYRTSARPKKTTYNYAYTGAALERGDPTTLPNYDSYTYQGPKFIPRQNPYPTTGTRGLDVAQVPGYPGRGSNRVNAWRTTVEPGVDPRPPLEAAMLYPRNSNRGATHA